MSNLHKAAQDVIDCVDSPYIPDEIRMVDVKLIEALRQAVQDAEVYTPLTDDTFHKIASENIDEMNAGGWINLYETYGKAVERAVIKRLGLRWPE